MKVFSAITILVFTSKISFAQTQFGVYAGAQANNVKYLIDKTKQDTKIKTGFHLGANMKVPFESNLFFAPAISYSYKGYDVTFNKYALPPDVNAANNRTGIHTVDISPLLQIDLGKNSSHAFIRFGPSIDVLLSGKENYDLRSSGSVSQKMNIGITGVYGMFGASLIGQFGFEMNNGFSVFAQYSHGIGSIVNQELGPRVVYRNFGISIGKYFKKDKIVIDTRNRQ